MNNEDWYRRAKSVLVIVASFAVGALVGKLAVADRTLSNLVVSVIVIVALYTSWRIMRDR